MKRFTTILLLSLLFVTAAFAQVAGRVVDETTNPVPYANVVVLSLPDSTVTSGVTTSSQGTFSLPSPTEEALLRITLVGYEPLYRRITAADHNLGNLTLEVEGQRMGEATVTATRPVARLVGDALVTDIAGTTLQNEGTAGDVLAKVPGLLRKTTEDGDSYEVLGKGKPVIYINGREMRDDTELTRLRSDEIKSVEVIRNPGAEYDAAVSAVVRIRTVKRRGDGFGVDAELSYDQGRYADTEQQLNLNYRHGGLELFAGINHNIEKAYWDSEINQKVLADTLWQTDNAQHGVFEEKDYTITAGFNYDVSEKHSFGLRYELTNKYHGLAYGSFNSSVLADGTYNDSLRNSLSIRTDHSPTHAVNVYYNGGIGKGELHVDADFYADGEGEYNCTSEQSSEHEDRVVNSVNNVRNRLVAGKATYSFPFLGGKLNVGGQYTFTNRHDDYLIPDNTWGVATSRSQLKQQNAAGFLSFSRPIKIGMLTAGLRYEYVRFDYYKDHLRFADQSRSYNNFFPSLSLATKIGNTQVMAAYTAKTIRPSYSQLSANVTYANRYLMQGGNPFLKNGTAHDVTLTAVWKFLQGVLTFTQRHDAIFNWPQQLDSHSNTTKLTYVNKDYPEYTAVFTVAPRIGFWQPQLTMAVDGTYLKMETATGTMRFSNPLFVGMASNAFTLPADFVLNVDYRFQSRGDYTNVKLANNMHVLNVSLQKSFLRDKNLTLIVAGRDLLHEYSNNVHINGAIVSLQQIGWGDTRSFSLTLRYKFNTSASKYKGESAAGDELQRLSGSHSQGVGR